MCVEMLDTAKSVDSRKKATDYFMEGTKEWITREWGEDDDLEVKEKETSTELEGVVEGRSVVVEEREKWIKKKGDQKRLGMGLLSITSM